jgi:thiol:disulfide interchange protein DsbD
MIFINRRLKSIFLIFGLFFAAICMAQQSTALKKEPLAADQAFQFLATARDNQTILTQWNIAPGYYLYRDRFHFSVLKPTETILGQPLFPEGEAKSSPELGHYQIYKNSLIIPIPVIKAAADQLTLKVVYQGCSSDGFCYPPATKIVSVNLAGNYMSFVAGSSPAILEPSSAGSIISAEKLLANQNIFVILLGFLGFGLLIAFTPCVLPMIPILSSIIVGRGAVTLRHALGLSVAYVLGMAITYAVAGILVGFLGGTLQAALQKPWIIAVFSLVFVLLALSLFGFFNLELPEKWRSYFAARSQQQKKGSWIGTVLMGVFSTLILSPCVTPPLVAVLGYIGHTGNAALGGAALFVMGIGMGIPLILIAIGGAKYLPKTGPWMVAVKNILGILLLAIAVWMLQRIIPGWISMLLWAALAIGVSFYLGALRSTKTIWEMVRKTIGLLFFVYGIVLVVGALQKNYNPLTPLALEQCSIQQESNHFKIIKTEADLKNALNTAKAENKPVLLDFYADWCVSCIQMEHYTFNNPEVKNYLKKFILLRADVTANDVDDKTLQKSLNVIAPPTIIFFDREGNEINNSRVVGETSAMPFLEHLRKILDDDIAPTVNSFRNKAEKAHRVGLVRLDHHKNLELKNGS